MSEYLHHHDFGCLSRCPNGCCLHLYFGDVALCLKPGELAEWRQDLTMLYHHHLHAAHLPDPQARCLTLPGAGPHQAFVFTLGEAGLLQDLLTSAALNGNESLG